MKRIYLTVPSPIDLPKRTLSNTLHNIMDISLCPFYLLMGRIFNVPGLSIHFKIVKLGMKLRSNKRINSRLSNEIIFYPIDSFRYFEFDFTWRSLSSYESMGRYMDISSPRMIPILVITHHGDISAEIINPDKEDLAITQHILSDFAESGRIHYHNNRIEELDIQESSIDTITCISVLEHIPDEGDFYALKKIWGALKPGGKFLVSVPCSRERFEEYLNVNQYGLSRPNKDNMYFGQRFYDHELIRERFFCIFGTPVKSSIYGEKMAGFYSEFRDMKLSDPHYRRSKEPYIVGRYFRYFRSIEEMPGIGVMAMEFAKPR